MELYVKERRWSINRVTGKRTEHVVTDARVPCEVGDIEPLRTERRNVTIDEVSAGAVKISFHYFTNPDGGTTLTVERGEREIYAPRSFGAGSIYEFELK